MQKKRRSLNGSGSYIQILVRCPFYKKDDGHYRIVCEGIVENSTITLTHQRESHYKKQMEIFCCDRYKNCEVYRMLMEKYTDE